MPNHVTHQLYMYTPTGDPDIVEEILEFIGTDHPEQPRRVFNGQILCKNKDDRRGYFDEKENKFYIASDGKPGFKPVEEDGLPDGWEYIIQPAYREHFDFAKIVPPPDDPAYRDEPSQKEAQKSPNWWYIWNINNWGTKWGAYSCSVDGGDNMIQFDTAWSPPLPIIAALSEMYPTVEFFMQYIDEGWNFAGNVTYKNGEQIEHKDIDCDVSSSEFCDLHVELYGSYPETYDEKNDEWVSEEPPPDPKETVQTVNVL